MVDRTSFLGPSYNYAAAIKGPTSIGMSDGGSFSALANDVGGLIQYIQVLVSGSSQAQMGTNEGPMGNRYILDTVAQCKDIDSGEMKTRSIYVNNIPTGNIPFISGLSGTDFFRI